MPFTWVWMDCSLLYVPQFFKDIFYSNLLKFHFRFIKLFVVVWFYYC